MDLLLFCRKILNYPNITHKLIQSIINFFHSPSKHYQHQINWSKGIVSNIGMIIQVFPFISFKQNQQQCNNTNHRSFHSSFKPTPSIRHQSLDHCGVGITTPTHPSISNQIFTNNIRNDLFTITNTIQRHTKISTIHHLSTHLLNTVNDRVTTSYIT